MIEIDDYNGDYFFEKEEEWLTYESILEDYDSPGESDKDSAYNIFSLEQALSVVNELSNDSKELSIVGERVNEAMNDFIKMYTRISEDE